MPASPFPNSNFRSTWCQKTFCFFSAKTIFVKDVYFFGQCGVAFCGRRVSKIEAPNFSQTKGRHADFYEPRVGLCCTSVAPFFAMVLPALISGGSIIFAGRFPNFFPGVHHFCPWSFDIFFKICLGSDRSCAKKLCKLCEKVVKVVRKSCESYAKEL